MHCLNASIFLGTFENLEGAFECAKGTLAGTALADLLFYKNIDNLKNSYKCDGIRF